MSPHHQTRHLRRRGRCHHRGPRSAVAVGTAKTGLDPASKHQEKAPGTRLARWIRLDYQATRPREPKPPPPRAPPSRLSNPAATRSRRSKPPPSHGPSSRPEIPAATGSRRPWNEVAAPGTAAVRRKIPAAPGTAAVQTQGPRRHLHQGHKPMSWLPLAAAEERERGGKRGGGGARVSPESPGRRRRGGRLG
ncbi:hypothetical protein D1007_20356 [Hordeum vulgare]|nr:hypothetical protein D1007_20356 [Hordeum vulgare]